MDRTVRTWTAAALAAVVTGQLQSAPRQEKPPTDGAPDLAYRLRHSPEAVPIGPFTIYDSHCRTPAAWTVAHGLGIGQVPLLNNQRYYDPVADDIDLDLYAEKIWTPGFRPECTSHLDGVPPWHTGPVWLDYEKWDEFRRPENYTILEIFARYFQYVTLIEATRAMRPDCTIILHNMLRTPADGNSLVAALERSLHLAVDATSPSLWVQCPEPDPGFGFHGKDLDHDMVETTDNCMTFEESWNIYEPLLELALEVKAQTGLKVYPVVWYRFKLVNAAVPDWLMGVHLERILTFERAGQRVDGVLILGGASPANEQAIEHMAVTVGVAHEVMDTLTTHHSDPEEGDVPK